VQKFLQPTLTTITEYPPIKLLITFLGILFSRFVESLRSQFLSTIILLVVFDTITGVVVASRKKRVSSWGWSRSAIKLVNYCILLSIGKLTSAFLLLAWLSEVLILLIMITEVISILENISIIQPKLLPKKFIEVLAIFKNSY